MMASGPARLPPPASAVRSRIIAAFFLQGIVAAMLMMRVPDLQLRAGLSPAWLGMVLMGGPLGGLAVYPVAAKMVERTGTRNLLALTFPLMALSALMVAALPWAATMFASLIVFGATNSLSNIAINVEADRVEAATGRRVMNRCHGFWSIGFFLAASLAGMVRGAGIDPVLHMLVLLPVFTALSLLVALQMVPQSPRLHDRGRKSRFARPTLAVLVIVLFGLGAELFEGASRVWATIYLRDSFQIAPIIESCALPALVLSMALCRLVADRLIDRYGPVRFARVSLGLAFAGVATICLAPSAWVAISGFALAGAGSAAIYPLMLSAAARIGDRPAAENVAAATLVIQMTMLVAPMLVGLVAQTLGIRVAYAMLLPLLAVGITLSRKAG